MKKIFWLDLRWWQYKVPFQVLWPIFSFLFLFVALSVFNLLSIWLVREEMASNLQKINEKIDYQQPVDEHGEKINVFVSQSQPELEAIDNMASSSALVGLQSNAAILNDFNTQISSNVISSSSNLGNNNQSLSPDLKTTNNLPVVSGASADAESRNNNKTVSDVFTNNTLENNNKIEPKVVETKINDKKIIVPPAPEKSLAGCLSSFGDSFSGLSYIDKNKTDMFWDENVTAFSFLPLYEIKKQQDCSIPDCGLVHAVSNSQPLCLSTGCLSRNDQQQLFFNDKILKLPEELSGRTISSLTLFVLDSSSWLIGLVSGDAAEEIGWVYRFNGTNFSPLITTETAAQIKPRFRRGGGAIAFGGSSDDFLAVYSGYDGKAFRFRNGNVEDLTRFFGLRVTAGGFQAKILKTGVGKEATFYICSLTDNKPKIIKIWSKDTFNSGGAIDLSPLLFKDDWRPNSITCVIEDAAQKKIAVASRRSKNYQLWSVQDKGFDNSRTYQISSVNLNRRSGEKVQSAMVSDFDWGPSYGDGRTQLYLTNTDGSWEKADPNNWLEFKKPGNQLFWRLTLTPGTDASFSPWINHINRLDYLFASD